MGNGRQMGQPLYAADREDFREIVRLVRPGTGLMLFDELEDMFNRDIFSMMKSGSSSKLPKQSFNDLLETTPVPIIWTSNSIEAIDPAFLRRFCYAIEVKPAGWRQRRRGGRG